MDKIVEYLKNKKNEKTIKIVSSIFLFFVGLKILLWGCSLAVTNFPACVVLCIIGGIAGILGAIPLICFWTGWQNLND